MLAHFARRLLVALATLMGVTMVTFWVVYRIPADPAALLAGQSASPETIANIRTRLKLDRPLATQYLDFVSRLARGDLGESFSTGEPVALRIGQRLPATAQLALAGWSLWLILGTLVGASVAANRSRWSEAVLLAVSIVGVSTPTVWVGILLLSLFVGRLNWLPAGGVGTPAHLILPVATLAVSGIAYYARLAHAGMKEVLDEDYVRTATAKGMSRGAVIFRHALRNALLPLVTVAGTDLGALLGGVVFTESVFAWPGMGRLAVEAVTSLDIPLIMGVVLVSAVFVVLANLVVDLAYPLLDPRIKRS